MLLQICCNKMCNHFYFCLDQFSQLSPPATTSSEQHFENPNEPSSTRATYSDLSPTWTSWRRRHADTWRRNCELMKHRISSQLSLQAACDSQSSHANFTLVQAQVILRHGARTPIWLIPGVPEARYDKKIFRSVLSHTDFEYDVMHLSGSKAEALGESIIAKRYQKRVLEGGINLGQLTTVGMQQCYELGLILMRRYMYQHNLLDPKFDAKDVYMRSTYILRTIESLQGVVAGLYGVDQLQSASPKPRFETSYYNEEHIYPNVFLCDCLKEIANHGNRHLNDHHPGRVELLRKVAEALKYEDEHKPLDFVALRDDLVARDAHSQILPPELQDHFTDIQQEASIEFVQKISGKPEDRAAGLMLALGPFHHLLINNMRLASEGTKKSPKLYLYSSHDSMVMPLLVALGCYDWNWPPFASYIAYELWKHKTNGQHYIKIIYNGKELVLPGKTDSMMKLSEFIDFISPFTVSPKDWKYMCENSRASIEAPPVEHSLHYGFDDSELEPSIEEKEEDSGEAPAGM